MGETTDKTKLPGEPIPVLRCVVGGALMGLANLVPGISGGTMLLAAGAYPRFISAVAELSTFRFRRRSLITVGLVAGSATVAIGALAALVLMLVVDHRWIMYSLFIGLTLGGVPVVWSLLKPPNNQAWAGAMAGFVAMAALAWMQQSDPQSAEQNTAFILLFFAGVAGASAMILPGVSGAYLLLLLGVYIPILESIRTCVSAVRHGELASFWEPAFEMLLPVGLGVVCGVVVVSNLLRWLLVKATQPTLGVLLGLLVGAVAGLWPFRAPTQPQPGDVIRGQTMTPELIETLEPRKWPTELFPPDTAQVLMAIVLIATSFALTSLLSRLGGSKKTSKSE